MNVAFKKILFLFQIILIGSTTNLRAQMLNEIESHRVSLPNGWKLTPVGKLLPLGDLPLNIAVSPSKKLAAITNNGESDQTIQLVDIEHEVILDSITIGKAWPVKISVAGMALDDPNKRLYVVTKENNSLYVIDIQTKKVLSQYPLGGEGYTCLLSPDHKLLYISCWGCDKVVLFDTHLQKITGSIDVGDNPNDLCITRNGQYLFVANSNDNSVSVIDTRQRKSVETLNSALYPGSPSGSTTKSEELSDDEKSLYIANADNDLAVGLFVDYLSHSRVWKNSLVIIVEDDAQNGPDHVDAHRSPAHIAGGFVKKGFVDHTAYTTTSLLRTIELILGLPPMSQYDAPATPLWRCMKNTADHPPFKVRPCNIDLNLKNLAENVWQKKSEKFDFTKEDMVSDVEFNEVIWRAVKGLDYPCPPAVHAAFFKPENKSDKD